jgi:aryl-alcohol dehydrogenase-like predicted oxidoreductase
VADKYNATIHQVALCWLLHYAPNILLIPGTSRVEHLEDNMKAADIKLDEADMLILESLRDIK